jgi:hypothetical protein
MDQLDTLIQQLGQQRAGIQSPAISPIASLDFGANGPPPDPVPLPPEDFIVSPDPNNPRTPDQRMEGFRRMLTNFTFDLGSGLSAASANPRGRTLRTEAGMGAILQMPKNLQDQQQAFQERQAAAKLAKQKAVIDAIQTKQRGDFQDEQVRQTEELRRIQQQTADQIKAKNESDAAAKTAAEAGKAADARTKLFTEGAKIGQVPEFDDGGTFTNFRKMNPDELSAVQQSVVDRNQSVADVNKERIRVGGLAKTEAPQLQIYNAYRDQMTAAGKPPLMLDEWLSKVANMKETQPRTRVITTVDEDGNPITKIVGDTVGGTWLKPPPMAEQNRIGQAKRVQLQIDDALELIDKHPENIGPINGRIEDSALKVGSVDPKYSQLVTNLGSIVAMMPILHGFRGGSQAMDHFNTIVGDPHLSPAALKASLNTIKRLALEIETGKGVPVDDNGEPITASATAKPPAATLPGGVTLDDIAKEKARRQAAGKQ